LAYRKFTSDIAMEFTDEYRRFAIFEQHKLDNTILEDYFQTKNVVDDGK